MTNRTMPSVRPLPMISVADVEASSRWYQQVLGARSGHGGAEYEQLVVDGALVLQLHHAHTGHHHGTYGDPDLPFGNGIAVWFEAEDFDAAVKRAETAGARVQTDTHLNPNSGRREFWLRDPDDYLVVLSEPFDPPS